MSEHQGERPLTRRELRLRAMVESGQASSEAEAAERARAAAEQPAEQPDSVAQATTVADDDIEISPFNEDGTPRSRREIRELRQKIQDERDAARTAGQTEDQSPHEAERQAHDAAEDDTEQQSHDEAVAEQHEVSSAEQLDEAAGVGPGDSDADIDTADIDTADVVAADVENAQDDPETDDPGALGEEPAEQTYSFPDIAPLEEQVSVFDDPATRAISVSAADTAEGGDFDDLISRAVAQEGAVSTTNTSALILPSIDDTGGLSGPIGETGELYVTGMINLPKSLGETGGHTGLHDTDSEDGLAALGLEAEQTGDHLNTPVSAKSAVSARGGQGPIIAGEAKEKSKLPIVLISTGGVLIVVVVGLIVWGALGLFG